MYAKYEKLLGLPRPLFGVAGIVVVVAFSYFFRLHLTSTITLLVYLALCLAAPNLARFLIRRKVTPNQVTILGFIVSLAAFWPLAAGRLELGLLIILASGFLDVFDGYLARQGGRVSAWGGFLDSVLDRVADASLLGGLCLNFVAQGRPAWAGLTLAALVGAFMVSYVRAKAERFLESCETGFMGERPDRMIALVICGFIGYIEIGILIVLVFAWLTVIKRTVYTWRRLEPMTENGMAAEPPNAYENSEE